MGICQGLAGELIGADGPEGDAVSRGGGLEAIKVALIGGFFEDKHHAGVAMGLQTVMQGLPDRLGPLGREVEFDGMGGCQAIHPCAVWQTVLCHAMGLRAHCSW